MYLKNFDVQAFLADHWQRKPLLVRNAWDAWQNPLTPDELAGLACEADVNSRLIIKKRATWSVKHGPLTEKRFTKLGKKPWTLLVQSVDHYVSAVAALLEPFHFIPNWRIDDVMVSYASDGGGVGPHFDQYDVFLIQGLGRRRWQIGAYCNASSQLLAHDELRLLANFEPAQEWMLEPGDMLYLPPGVAHNGIAVGDDCMTYSVGFRAPAVSELIADWTDDICAMMNDDDRYSDAGLSLQANPGEITEDALDRLHAMVMAKVQDREAFAHWFGRANSTPKYFDLENAPEDPTIFDDVRKKMASGAVLQRNPASRFSFIRREPMVILFVDGKCFECEGETAMLAELLCRTGTLHIDITMLIADASTMLLERLLNMSSLAFIS